jgi:protein gp37
MTATKIQWTNAVWNPVTGCSKVSPGCAHCYAETIAARFWPSQYVHTVERGFIAAKDYAADRLDGKLRRFTDVMCHEDRLEQPLHWKGPRRIFVNSMSDLFHDDVPSAFIDRVFAVMALTPRHQHQVLTKRIWRARRYLLADGVLTNRRGLVLGRAWEMLGHPPLHKYEHEDLINRPWPLPNVWIGPSVENQAMADQRFPDACAFGEAGWHVMVSMEPLLGPVTIPDRFLALGRRALVIVGGESGAKARPCALEWLERPIAQCRAAGVHAYVKQLGAFVVSEQRTCEQDLVDTLKPAIARRMLKAPNGEYWAWRAGLQDKSGGDIAEFPESLRVRELPELRP